MFDFWSDWIDAAALGFEAQSVIAMRMMKIAMGGPAADAECELMFAEKFAAVAAAHSDVAVALAGGMSLPGAVALALAPVRRKVRANHLIPLPDQNDLTM
jgi:hypothetical protein